LISFVLVVSSSYYYKKVKQDVPEALRRAPQAAGQQAAPMTELSRAEIREYAKKTKLEDINKALKTTKWTDALKEEGNGNDGTCCICVDDFKKGLELHQTPCGHIFHTHCLAQWIESKIAKPDCPYCREQIKFEDSSKK
jgi:hypothetical protein